MKALWNKHTKLNKFIAFCLVLLLAVVPMLTYVGDKEGAKAATTVSDTGYFNFTLTESGADFSLTEQAGGSGTVYYMKFDGTDNVPTTQTFSYFADKLSFAAAPTLSEEEDHSYNYNSNSFEARFSGYELQYVKIESGTPAKYQQSVTSPCALTDGRIVGDLRTDYPNGIAVYMKPTVSSTTDTTDGAVNTLNAAMGYTLIGVWKFEKISLTAPVWSGDRAGETGEPVSLSATAYKSATLSSNTDILGKTHAGTIKYAYIKSETEPNSDAVAAVANWTTSVPILNGASVDEGGIYYGCVAYFANDASGNATSLTAYKLTTTPVNLDITAPEIQNLAVQYGTSGTWSNIEENDISGNAFTLGSSEQLRISFTIPDTINGNPTVKLGTTPCTLTSSSSVTGGTEYVYENVSITTEGTITVTATDAAGNEGSSTYQFAGNAVNFVKMSTGFDVTSAKIVGSNTGSAEITLPTDGSTTYINKQWYDFNGIPSIKIAMQSDQTTINETSSGTVDANYEYKVSYNTNTDMRGTATYSRPYYQTTIEQSLGTTSQKFENIKLEYKKPSETSNSTVDYGTVICDYDKPVIDVAKLQRKNASGVWENVPDSDIENNQYYINQRETTQYRYYVDARDVNSGLADTGVVCNNALYTFVASSVPGESGYECIIINPNMLPETIEGATSVNVSIDDKAGNVSETKSLPILIKQTGTKISPELLDNETSVDVSDATLSQYITKNDLTLKVEVSSGADITDVSFSANVNGVPTTFVATNISNEHQMDSKLKVYQATYEFKIPAHSDINSIIANGALKVITDDPSYDASMQLRTILYDSTIPVFKATVGSTVYYLNQVDVGWQQSYDLNYTILSGEGAYIESDIANATYTIDNTKPEDAKTNEAIFVNETALVSGVITIPESATIEGTRVAITATDVAGNAAINGANQQVYIKVDKTEPSIGDVSITGYTVHSIPIAGYPNVSAVISDNLTLQSAEMKITYPNDEVKTTTLSDKEQTGLSESISYQIAEGAPDGDYRVEITAKDKAGNEAVTKVATFKLDNTKPVVTAAITSGTVGGKATRADGTDMYYRSDVGVTFTCSDENIKSITVTDNGSPVEVNWSAATATINVSGESRHVIKISATDMSGNKADEKQVEFIIDKSVPAISLALNGLPYQESRGVVDCSGDSTVGVTVSDMTVDAGDLHYQVIQTKPDQATTTSQYLATDARSFTFGEEADYTMNFYAIDMANNQSTTRSISFRIDKAAPELTISGVAGGSSSNATTVSFSMKEAFWKDASGVITIYRKAGDGSEESLYKTVNVTPTAFETVISETLTETGVYRMEFKASDRVGHSASKEQTFTIDREAPVITLSGVNNFDVTDQTVELRAEIADDFYSSKTVSIEGTKTDINGKVTNLSFSSFNQHGNPTVIGESFDQDGIYDITITSKDAAGNSHSSTVHFTVDKTAPKIEGLEELDGAILTSFDFGFDLDELVSDLTVCDVHMYLNGSEYDGVSAVEDGSYTLLITAEDELGHYSELSVSFVLDTKAPVFIVTGVEDGEVKQEAYSIDVSLQLEEDTLTSVTLNGETVVISNNTAHIDVTAEGDYTLCMKAVDEAGNEAEQTIEFRYGQESHLVLWICIIVGIIILAGIIIFIILRRKKNK